MEMCSNSMARESSLLCRGRRIPSRSRIASYGLPRLKEGPIMLQGKDTLCVPVVVEPPCRSSVAEVE